MSGEDRTVLADQAGDSHAHGEAGATPQATAVRGGLAPGQTLGRYTIARIVGEGGMGCVYAAHDPLLDRHVALKVLHPGHQVSEEARARLLREARAMAKLSHPNVITVYEVGSEDGTDFVAMELIEGETLASWLARGARPWREVAEVLLGAGRALAAAHSAGLVHRDFKPANVLLGKRGRVVVTDFGLARFVHAARPDSPQGTSQASSQASSMPSGGAGAGASDDVALEATAPSHGSRDSGLEVLTAAGAIMGTPAYMAPEQHAGSEPDERTDQFGFCVALYEALYGVRPFTGKSLGEIRRRAKAGQVSAPERKTSVPARLGRAVRRGLEPKAGDRHPSMDALLAEIERALGRRRRLAYALAGAAAVVSVAGATMLAGGDSAGSPCGDGDEQLVGIWDDDIEAEVREALAEGGADAPVSTAIEHLGDYARAWQDTYEGVCEATYGRGEVSEDDYLLARQCLSRRRRELGSLAEVFRDAGESAVENAAVAAQGLPRIADCEDWESLRAGIAPPEDEATRHAVRDVRNDLAEVRALWEAGRARRAETPAEEALSRAREVGYDPLIAEALYQAGEIHIALDGVSAAREALDEAEFLAEVEGHDELRARALVARVDAETRFSSDHDEIFRIAERARAAVDRHGRDARLGARMDRALARIYRERGDYDGAEEALSAALAGYQRDEGPESVRAAETKGELAELYAEFGRFEESLEVGKSARETAAGALGRDHALVVDLEIAVAEALQALGRYDEARAVYDELEARARDGGAPPAEDARAVSGRVVDQDGEPVGGAEVAIGNFIIGDGKYAHGYRRFGRGFGAHTAETDRGGRFSLGDLPTSALAAVAEHDGRGRSMPLRIASGERDADGLVLELAPFGRVEGELTVKGDAPPVIWVVARPQVDLDVASSFSRIPVRPGEPFVFERLGPGPHALSLSAVLGQKGIQGDKKRLVVKAGETLRADLTLDRTGHDLAVTVRGPGGEAIPWAEVFLFRGRHNYAPAADLERALHRGSEDFRQRDIAFPDRPAQLAGISPGAYSLCVVPTPIDLKNRELAPELAPHRGDVPVHCEPIDVEDEAEGESALTLEVSAAPALSELIEKSQAR